MGKDSPFVWGEEQDDAFTKLKEILTKEPVLELFDIQGEHQVHTDASKHGLEGILMQKRQGKIWAPVAYFSRKTTAVESNYHSYELEALAVVESVEKFRIYLLGRHFRVVTHCGALKTAMSKRDMLARTARWWLRLQEFNFDVECRPGTKMQHADALSRSPYCEPDEMEVADLCVL